MARSISDLTDTDLVKKKDMFDCWLRLEGTAPNYKLVYSLGEITVPEQAVKAMYDRTFVLLGVTGAVSGMSVTSLFIPYHNDPDQRYIPRNSGPLDHMSDYTMTVREREENVLSALRKKYPKDLVVDRTQGMDLDRGAVLVRSHPVLSLGGMDGLSGAKDERETRLYYVCSIEQ